MILGPISYLDCLVFCVFLAPQLLLRVGLLGTLATGLQCLPFLCKLDPPSQAKTEINISASISGEEI